MGVNIFCIYNDQGIWCKNIKVKTNWISLRMCVLFPPGIGVEKRKCEHQSNPPRPLIIPPSPPPKRIINEDIFKRKRK